MKNIISLIIVLFIVISPFQAKAQEVSGGVHLYDKYLAFGSGGVLYDEAVVHSYLRTSFDNGLWIELWHSVSVNDAYKENYGNEVDYSVGYNGSVGEFGLAFQFTYFDEPNLLDLAEGDIWYGKVDISREFHGFTVGVNTRVYVPTAGSGFEGGWLIGPYVSKGFDLTDKLSVFTKFAANYDDGGFGFNPGIVLENFTSLSYKVSDKLTWDILEFTGYIPTMSDAREADFVLGTGISFRF